MMHQFITTTLSLFGNFNSLLSKEKEICSTFSSYKFDVQNNKLNNGLVSKICSLSNGNKVIIINSNRIDFKFGYPNDNVTILDFYDYIQNVTQKLEYIEKIYAWRIAYNSNEFINYDNQIVKTFNESFNITKNFGKASDEFGLRLNHKKEIKNELCNCVITIQDGQVTHNVTNETRNAIFINNDINSLIQNKNLRFTLKDAPIWAKYLSFEAENRSKTFLESIKIYNDLF